MTDANSPGTDRVKHDLQNGLPSVVDMCTDAAALFEAAARGEDVAWNAARGMRSVLFGAECCSFETVPAPLLDRLESAIEQARSAIADDAAGCIAGDTIEIGLGALAGLLRLYRLPFADAVTASDPLDQDRFDHASALVDELDLLTRRRRIAARGNLLAGMIGAARAELFAPGAVH